MESEWKFLLLLLVFFAGKGVCLLDRSIPPSGSLVEGYEGDANVTIFCSVRDSSNRSHVTSWFVERPDQPGDLISVTDGFEGVVITGELLAPGSGSNLRFDTNFTILNLTLEWHETIVHCGVDRDEIAAEFTVKIFMPPGRPGAVIVNDTGLTFATLIWERPMNPGHPELTEYRLFVRREDGSSPLNIPTTVDVTTKNVTDLVQGAKYIASVMASSPKFEGEFSDPLNFMTTVIPLVIECDGSPEEGNGEITVSWNVIESGGADLNVIRIHVGYKISDSPDSFTVLVTENITDGSQTTLEVDTDFLLSGIEYTFRISAENEVELGNPVECPPVRLETGQPHTPAVPILDTVYPTLVILDLSTPQAGVGPPPHSFGFEVTVYQNDTGTNFTVRKMFARYQSGESEKFTVDDLEVEREYRFTAIAFNEFGQSSPSEFSESAFLEVSEPLIEGVEFATSTDQIVVSWSYSHTGGRPLTAVIVEYREGDEPYQLAPNGNLTDLNLTTLNFPGNLFTAGESYQFRVTATNQINASLPLELMPFTAAIGIPQTPGTPSIESIMSDGVVLRLSTAASGVLNPQYPSSFRFEVKIFSLSAAQRQQTDVQEGEFLLYQDGDEVEFTVEDLEAGEYRFSARAVNEFGMSEFSMMSERVNVRAGGLTGGAVAGIVIAIIVVLIVIALIILVLVCVGTNYCSCMLGGNTKDRAEPMPLEYTPNLYNSKTVPPETTDGPDPQNTYATIADGTNNDHETTMFHTHTPNLSQRSSQDNLSAPKQTQNDAESLYDSLAPTHDPSPHPSPSRDSTAHNPLYVRIGDPEIRGRTLSSSRDSATEVEISIEVANPTGSEFV